ncbi:SagB/ThcOx family dehydrogenase [Halanaerobiaceae bacterium Z-7014]|uniref:SagB/ThcOx family dehydrogenase n=1 Tax=Halonatronomonas betaini TaxID=2778430 RepID=A0A931F8M6_9FIRM|nr:SagB/ThcOx family dehydrogenase [Halonatronomonas betaini]MBF8437906.1 SagB/ThcOx family dehydrogenase [Halonatronomonas betaini]
MEKDVKEFLEATYYGNLSPSDQSKEMPSPSMINQPENIIESFKLPDPEKINLPEKNIINILEERRTRRAYSNALLNKNDLSLLLYYTQGIKKTLSDGRNMRTVPSAGARHPFETYFYLNKSKELPNGLYYYNPLEHEIFLINHQNLTEELIEGAIGQKFIKGAAAIFCWVANYYRTAWRYSERSFRYIHLDGGHICQNLYLIAEALNYGVCAIAAYDDKKMNKLLNLNSDDRFIAYMASLGGQKN